MATIKSFTDLNQSKKLAEILPLESADMRYEYPSIEKDEIQEPMIGFHTSSFNWFKESDSFIYFPCWSLAALLGILPQSIEFKGDKYYLRFMKEYVEYANDEVSITGRYLHTTGNDNLVDACYDMIIRLHELNLL